MMASLVAALLVAGTIGTTTAHTFESIHVDVPFDFSDGSTVFAAGKYTILPVGINSTAGILITSDDGKVQGIQLCFNARVGSPKDETALVFHRYGQQYFLFQVWTAGDSNGLELPKSPTEHKVERVVEANDGQSASNSLGATITVAARLPGETK